MTPKAREIVKAVLQSWRRGKLYQLAQANILLQLCQELEGEIK